MSRKAVDWNSSQSLLGYFGKIPTYGDFISYGLPREFTGPWDQWLQRCIATSRRQLGDQWLDYFLTSPLWRFAVSPGVCGDHAWAGVLMPSVDQVNRHFPLTMAAAIKEENDVLWFLFSSEEWYSKVENLVLSTLNDGFDLDSFNQAIPSIGAARPKGLAVNGPPLPFSRFRTFHFSLGAAEPLSQYWLALSNARATAV